LKKNPSFFLNLFVGIYALYAYFNKGVAYAFLVEALLALGLMMILFKLKYFVMVLNKPAKILLFFMGITVLAIFPALLKYPFKAVAQDASMFLYAGFVFIVFLFRGQQNELLQKISLVYRWYPLVVFVNFILVSYVPFFQEVKIFGGIPLMLYKYGDMAVHLLIATLMMFCGMIRLDKKWTIINGLLIAYLFLVIATYNRAGMMSYLAGISLFLWVYRKRFSAETLRSYLRFAPLLLLMVIGVYVNTRVDENFQGRKVGLEQLKQNVLSIFDNSVEEGGLSDNKVWRLVWWYSILQQSTQGNNILFGRGLGENLAVINDVKTEDENLRSPHNFHLNVLARFGYPVFLLWIFWIVIHLKQINVRRHPEFQILILIAFLAFIINASFDVYLEGPMGAFPFWTWLGILYLHDSEALSV
jgi:hypothetical protein